MKQGLLLLMMLGALFLLGCGEGGSVSALRTVALPDLAGLPAGAQAQLREQYALAQGAQEGEAHGRLGQVLFTYDFLDAARPAFENAEALQPADVQWPYYLGLLHRQRGDFATAEAAFHRVLAVAPGDRLARVRLAELYLESDRVAEATALLDALIEADPDEAFAHFLRGQVAYEAEHYTAAVSHFEAVLRAQPGAQTVAVPLGMAYRNLGDDARSTAALARRGETPVALDDPRVRALEALKDASAATALTEGLRLLDAERFPEAVAMLEKAVAVAPTEASRHLNLGVARARAGDLDGAERAFRETIRLDPTKGKAHYNLGSLALARGDIGAAEAHFRAALDVDARHANAHLDLGELLRRDGRCADAVPHFAAALEARPGDIAARQHAALCALKTGADADARALLEAGHAAHPAHLGFADALARVLAAAPTDAVRDGTRALALAETAATAHPRTETLETLAMAYAETGRFEEARTAQRKAIALAETMGLPAYLVHLRATLRLYEADRPSRAPWPPFMYEL